MDNNFKSGDIIQSISNKSHLYLILEVLGEGNYNYLDLSFFMQTNSYIIRQYTFHPDYWRKIDKI